VKAGRLLLKLVAGTIGVYSLIGHKEWRFLMPILPLLYILTAAYLTRSTPSSTTSSFASSTSASPIYPSSARYHLPPILCSFFPQSTIRLPNPKILCILILLPLPFLTYLTLYHGAAQHSVITSYLRHDPSVSSFGVLMPCHSIPWQSHLHREALDRESWFLTCEPPKTYVPCSSLSLLPPIVSLANPCNTFTCLPAW
jgi:phosphatidylinositol glycan class B